MRASGNGGGLGGRQSFPFANAAPTKPKSSPSLDWRCTYASGIHIFASPDYFAARQGKIEDGTVFRVSREQKGADGVLWLELADGRGWVFDRSVGGFGTLCVRHEEPDPLPKETAPDAQAGAGKVQAARDDSLPELAPGTYVVTTENLKVTAQQSWSSALVARLDMGENVDVVEVVLVEEKKKQKRLRRGRLEKPSGWVTLQNLDSCSSTVAKHEAGRNQLEDVMAAVEEDKARGTGLFKAGKSYEAYEAWLRGAEKLEAFAPDGAKDPARKLKVALYNNMAQALLQCPEVEGACTEVAFQMADRVLALDPENVKARFRRGCAFVNAEAWQQATVDFEDVLALDPGNEAAAGKLRALRELLGQPAPEAEPPAPARPARVPAPVRFCPRVEAPVPGPGAGLRAEIAGFLAESNPNAPPQGTEAAGPAEAAELPEEPNPNTPPQGGSAPSGPSGPLDMAKADDPEEAIRRVHLDSQRLRRETLLLAEEQGCLEEWRERLDFLQRGMVEYAQHQLADPEAAADLELCWGPAFAAMAPQQREEFLSAHDFLSAVRDEYGPELERLARASRGSRADLGAEMDQELRQLADQFAGMAEENGASLDELS